VGTIVFPPATKSSKVTSVDPFRQADQPGFIRRTSEELPINDAIQLFGLETIQGDFRVRCTVCGGRTYDARGEAMRQLGH